MQAAAGEIMHQAVKSRQPRLQACLNKLRENLEERVRYYCTYHARAPYGVCILAKRCMDGRSMEVRRRECGRLRLMSRGGANALLSAVACLPSNAQVVPKCVCRAPRRYAQVLSPSRFPCRFRYNVILLQRTSRPMCPIVHASIVAEGQFQYRSRRTIYSKIRNVYCTRTITW